MEQYIDNLFSTTPKDSKSRAQPQFNANGYKFDDSDDDTEPQYNSSAISRLDKKKKGKDDFLVKEEDAEEKMSERTLEGKQPYTRRDNFIQTFRGLFLYWLKLMKFKVKFLLKF